MPILALENVSKSFGALKVTDDVSFVVPKGQALCIIGPIGAGKSTLFNLITGNIRADADAVQFDRQDITCAPPMQHCLAGMGRSFQIPQPFGNLTVFENLVVAATHGQNLAEAQVTDHCADVLAREMATASKLLLLDEIAGGLTEAECEALIDTIRALDAEGVTIIWIEHVLHALNSVAERLLVLDFGRIIGMGAPAEVMESRGVREI